MDVFDVKWKAVAEFLQNILRQRLSGAGDWSCTKCDIEYLYNISPSVQCNFLDHCHLD